MFFLKPLSHPSMTDAKLLPSHIRFWIFGASVASLSHEFVQAQFVTILWGGLLSKYTLAIGIFILALGLGAIFYPKKTTARVAFFWQQLGVGILGLIFPWALLWVGTHLAQGIAILFSAFLIFLVGFVSGFEFPLLSDLVAQPSSSADKRRQAFFQLMQIDYYGMALASIFIPVFAFRHFGVIETSLCVVSGNILIALSCYFQFRTDFTRLQKKLFPVLVLAALGFVLFFYLRMEWVVSVAQRWLTG